MKKLALALVCLVSVAFFASCNSKGNPTISVLKEEGYVESLDVVALGEEVNFGFVMSSSIETSKKLSKLVVTVDDEEWETVDLTDKSEYTYKSTIKYGFEKADIIAESTIKAVVTDVAGATATATIELSIEETDALLAKPFTWYRLGNTTSGLDQFGLEWKTNQKATHAQIKPMDGVKLYQFDSEKWSKTVTAADKAALFLEAAATGHSLNVYEGINTDVAGDKEYDDVIGTVTKDGYFLIHITHYNRGEYQNAGYPFTITGESK